MFRVSFVVLAMASALALNGCSQCSSTQDTAPATPAEAPAATPEAAAPAEAAPAAPAEGAAAPTEAATPAETPAAH